MFKAARVQKRLGVGVWGHIYQSWMAKSLEVRKIFHFCVFIPIEVFKNQEDCPSYLALKDHSILTN